ncbi:YbaK/EbsC family protein [Crenobacter cavernae]|uniref:YbaK/EbsC family protein n=1 Tax=Crenobacter cavernae TaxID=2290923 RepID=A0A345Y6G9_9NEIS|nr:YbaK/EbsC family protein [Crenobacter cavernae]AXK39521.1 YbaK/EbsC family protein [Crenobacter cavernae]
MSEAQHDSSVARVASTLAELGLYAEIREMAESTRTSAEAAAAIGCSVAQIAKSMVFRELESGRALIVVASGSNRVCTNKLATLTGKTIARADAAFVREKTGFAIGGVSPIAHVSEVDILLDQDLFQYEEIWAAAGSPYAVFRTTADALASASGARVADIKEG